jgi:hypothetical protein
MHADYDTPPPDAERLLRECRPVPDTEVTDRIERRLFDRPRRGRRLPVLARRPVFAGGVLAAAIASLVLILSLAGLGPLAPGGADDVKGSSNCTYVTVIRRVSVPEFTTDRNGHLQTVHRMRPLRQRVKRCR